MSGLVVVYLFFASISGVLIFALHQAVGRGLMMTDAVWLLALTKVAAGIYLMVTCVVSTRSDTNHGLLVPCSLLAAATVAIYLSRDNLALFAALLMWELAVNNLSVCPPASRRRSKRAGLCG